MCFFCRRLSKMTYEINDLWWNAPIYETKKCRNIRFILQRNWIFSLKLLEFSCAKTYFSFFRIDFYWKFVCTEFNLLPANKFIKTEIFLCDHKINCISSIFVLQMQIFPPANLFRHFFQYLSPCRRTIRIEIERAIYYISNIPFQYWHYRTRENCSCKSSREGIVSLTRQVRFEMRFKATRGFFCICLLTASRRATKSYFSVPLTSTSEKRRWRFTDTEIVYFFFLLQNLNISSSPIKMKIRDDGVDCLALPLTWMCAPNAEKISIQMKCA